VSNDFSESEERQALRKEVAKLAGKFANIHVSDNDPIDTNHLPIGDGSIDWLEFFRTLKAMDYAGYLGLDLGMSKSIVRDYQKSRERIQSIAAQFRIPMEV